MTKLNQDRILAYLDGFFDASRMPGLQICVYEGGEIALRKSYGVKDGEGTALDDDTVMGIASITKSITALAYSLLCEEGKATIDDPVIKYFPALKIPGAPAESLLARHLLNHTSGIPPLPLGTWCILRHSVPDEWEKDIFAEAVKYVGWEVDGAEDIVRYLSESGSYRPLGQPGQFYSYLNEGYALLTAIIGMVSGMAYEEYVHKKILGPIGMEHTAYRPDGFRNVTSLFLGPKGPASDGWYKAPPYLGGGYAVSTAGDIAKLYCVLSQNGEYRGRSVFPRRAVERLAGAAFPLSEASVYCFGLSKALKNGYTVLRHNGSLKGISSSAGFLMGEGRSYAIMMNIEGAPVAIADNALQNFITDAAPDLPAYAPAPAGSLPKIPEAYTGVYTSMEDLGSSITVSVGEGKFVCEFDSAIGGSSGEKLFDYCGTTVLCEDTRAPVRQTLDFHFEDDRAISVLYGGRRYQRKEG